MAVPTLDLTEVLAFKALRSFILGTTLSNIEVVRGEQSRVGEPQGSDFIVIWPLFLNRLGTDVETYVDNAVVGSITGTTLNVTQILSGLLAPGTIIPNPSIQSTVTGLGLLAPGQVLLDVSGDIKPNTIITKQISGTPGGIGTYTISIPQTLPSETIYAGVRNHLAAVEWHVQLDIHGPNSSDNTTVIEALFKSMYGVETLTASGLNLAPLYCDTARQSPFTNAQQQIEYRWTLDLITQLNPVVGTNQQFAGQLQSTTIEADVTPSAVTHGPVVIGPVP